MECLRQSVQLKRSLHPHLPSNWPADWARFKRTWTLCSSRTRTRGQKQYRFFTPLASHHQLISELPQKSVGTLFDIIGVYHRNQDVLTFNSLTPLKRYMYNQCLHIYIYIQYIYIPSNDLCFMKTWLKICPKPSKNMSQNPPPAPPCPAAIPMVHVLETQGWAPSARLGSMVVEYGQGWALPPFNRESL